MSTLANEFIAGPSSGGNYTKVLLVVHDTESPEVNGAARSIVDYWNRTRSGSTQYVVDNREIIQAVDENAYAWSAGTTANKWGIHVEHVGYASQRAKGWSDAYSTAELNLSAALFADLAARHGIPVRRLTVDQIRKAVKTGNPADGGICGHADITAAFPGETTHTDPGPNFPWDHFISLVQGADMPITEDDAKQIGRTLLHLQIDKSGMTVVDALRQASKADNVLAAVRGLPDKIVAALPATGGGVTPDQVKSAAEAAIRDVLGSLNQ